MAVLILYFLMTAAVFWPNFWGKWQVDFWCWPSYLQPCTNPLLLHIPAYTNPSNHTSTLDKEASVPTGIFVILTVFFFYAWGPRLEDLQV
jgi:hypothetical protein